MQVNRRYPAPLVYYEDKYRRKEAAKQMMKQHGITGVEWWIFETAPERFIREKEEQMKQQLEENKKKRLTETWKIKSIHTKRKLH